MKSLFEQLGGTYHEGNGYLIPDLRLPEEEEKEIGIWGQRHLDYLKQYRKLHTPIFLRAAGSMLILPTLTDRYRNALKGS